MTRALPSTAPPEAITGHGMRVARRNGSVAEFDAGRIAVAITKAFLAVQGDSAGRSSRLRAEVTEMTDAVTNTLLRRYGASDRPVDLEEVQDQVELALMRGGHAPVARAYILYREEHRRARADRETSAVTAPRSRSRCSPLDGSRTPLDERASATDHRRGLRRPARGERARRAGRHQNSPVRRHFRPRSSASRRSWPPAPWWKPSPATRRSPRGCWPTPCRQEALCTWPDSPKRRPPREMNDRYPGYFARVHRPRYRAWPTRSGTRRIRPATASAPRWTAQRDNQFTFLGLQTLYDRYFLHERRHEIRTAAGVLHAGRDGPRDPGDRPGGPGDRVLPAAVQLRFHVLHARPCSMPAPPARSCRPAS